MGIKKVITLNTIIISNEGNKKIEIENDIFAYCSLLFLYTLIVEHKYSNLINFIIFQLQ